MKSRPGATHPAVLYPEEYGRRVDEAMKLYDCDHSDAEGIVEAEYLDTQLNT
jgi:hypothetical protein